MNAHGRVRHLRLSLEFDTSSGSDAEQWRTQIEQVFLQSLLDACCETIHQRLGPRILLCIRRLHIRLELEPEALFTPDEALRQGQLLADQLLPTAQTGWAGNLPDPNAERVVFRSEAHRQAVLIAERLVGRQPGWYQNRQIPSGGPLADWLNRGPKPVAELLDWVTRLDAADGLFIDDPQLVAALGDVIPPEQWPAAVLRAAARVAPHQTADTPPQAADAPPPGQPSRPPDPATAEDHRATDPSVPTLNTAGPIATSSRPPAAPGSTDTKSAPPSVEPLSEETPPMADPAAETDLSTTPIIPPPGQTQATRNQPPAFEDGNAVPTESGSAHHKTRQTDRSSVVEGESGPAQTPLAVSETAFGGLFYLVGRVLELELGEQLWYAGLLENPVLYHAARLLTGPAAPDDPAPAVFSGTDPGSAVPFPTVEDWALAEVRDKLLATLTAELNRHLDKGAAGSAIAADLDTLATLFLLRSSIDSTGPAEQLVGLAAAAPALLFLRRAGLPENPTDLLPILTIPATLLMPRGRLLVTMPMSAIDLNLRRAGLDQNTGWVPWLKRKVELEYL